MYVILVWCWLRGYVATRLRSSQDLPFPLVYVNREKSGYAVVKTTPPLQSKLVRKEVATRLRGYAVTGVEGYSAVKPNRHLFA